MTINTDDERGDVQAGGKEVVRDPDQDQRAWRVAQLAAQLAGSDVLGHSMKPDLVDHLPEDKQKDCVLAPNSSRLDRWFGGLLDRADWLLAKSEGKHTGPWMFADFFEMQKRYSQNKMAEIISKHGIIGWSQQSISGKLKNMGCLIRGNIAKAIARDVYWLSMEDKGEGMPVSADDPSVVDESCVNRIRDVLIRGHDTADDLFCAVMKETRFLCGKLQGHVGEDGVLYYHTQYGHTEDSTTLSPGSIAEAHDLTERTGLPVDEKILPQVMTYFRYDLTVNDLPAKKKEGKGGSRGSAGILARDLFRLASETKLPEEYWSAPRV